jgi:hypothetical protein
MRKYLTRVAASTAVAAVAALSLAGPANAATVPAKTHTTLSIVEYRTHIAPGHRDYISGTLRAGAPGHASGRGREVVLLDRFYGKKLVPVRAGLTNWAGHISFTVSPDVTARYELVFRGTEKLHWTHSGVVTVKVIK